MLKDFLVRFPATVELAIFAMIFAVIFGVAFGIFAAIRRGSWFDQLTMGTALAGYSMPIFWWGLLLIIVFSGMLHWTPVSGRIDLLYFFKPVTGFMTIDSLISGQKGAFRSAVSHLILPTIVLGTIPLAVIARQTRSAMLEVLGEDYVRTARAKGLAPRRVIGLHAFRNALIPVVTTIGLQVGTLLTGAIDGAAILEPTVTTVLTRAPDSRVVARGSQLFPNQPGAVLLVAHWDHFGVCTAAGAICPGAVDNASGVAVITEVARQILAGMPQRMPDRDIYVLTTTGEEMGLLGALAFAENPPLPLGRIGKPDEIADLVAWLAGPAAGDMTGASLTIDGGWTA